MSNSHQSRLARIESKLLTRTCTTCFGNPTQIIGVDDDGETVNGIRFPDDCCPDCGRPIAHTAIRIYHMPFEDLWDPEPFNWIRGR